MHSLATHSMNTQIHLEETLDMNTHIHFLHNQHWQMNVQIYSLIINKREREHIGSTSKRVS